MSGRRWRTRLAAAAGSLLLGGGLAVSAAPPAQADENTQVLLLLDVSGSMNEKISSGGTKFAAAKRALRDVADALPAGTQVGLRVYGSEIAEPKDENPKACTDTELVLPIGPLNKAKMNDAVDSFTAKGETPIAHSLQQSVKDFGGDGKRVLVLISDGEETCAKDPCPTAKKLAKSGVDLQFNAIGLEVGAKARQQLQCITKAGDGNYYDAENTDDLTDALRRITQRALRPFQVTGTPVQGTEDVESAPPLGPGQYKDRYDASTIERYYRITRTPGSTVTASIGSIVRPYPRQNAEQWTMTLTTPDGVACATTQATTGSWKAVTPFGASVSSAQVDGATRKPAPAACATAPELTLSLKRQSLLGNDDDVAVEIVVAEEPEITNLSALPEPVTDYDGETGRVKVGKVSAVLGGTSFSNATEVSPATYTDSMATGETVFYRVRLQPGQRVRATATTPAPKTSWHLASAELVTSRVMLYSPSRTLLTSQEANLQGDGSVTVSAASPQVRVRNREAAVSPSWGTPSVSTASQAGDYYVAVQVDPLQSYLTGRVMRTRVAIAVDGSPTGLPEYAAAASPTPTPDPTEPTPAGTPEPSDQDGGGSPSEDTGGVPTWLTVTGVAVVAAAAGAGGVLLARRRSG
ncbi:MAG TPA: VWA domain-containing protein [Microlunatus sp.]|nr:VWA domain-containing protein [Microlunatus sp.]